MALEDIHLGIFDHSGVISDDRPPVYEANMILLERFGLPRMSFIDWLLASKASAGELVLSQGSTAPKAEIDDQYAQLYTEIVEGGLPPTMYSDAPKVLAELASMFKLAIVSSHPRPNLMRELEEYDLLPHFDTVSGDPSPKAARLGAICAQYGIEPGQAFFVEDTVYGLRSGHKAGVHCLGITTGYHSRERLEDEKIAVAVVDSLTELLQRVQ